MTERLVRVALVCAWLALTVCVGRAQSPAAHSLGLLQQWLDAVEQHTPGSIDAPLITGAGWGGADLDRIWIDAQALARGALEPGKYRFSVTPRPVGPTPGPPRAVTRSIEREERESFDALVARVLARGQRAVLHRAAVLHTDVILEAADVAAASGANESGASRRWSVGDGTGLGTQGLSLHLELARTLLAGVSPDPRGDTFVRDWYRATVAREQAAEYFDAPHLIAGLRLFPDDPELLLLAGAEREAMASPMFQAFARSIVSRFNLTGIGSVERELGAAAGFYRRALDHQPRFPEARLRLGHVLTRQGRPAEAVRELQASLDTGLDPTLEYYGWLFLGAAREGAGETDAALDAYRRATDLAVSPRAALLAVARVARERGDREQVTASLARALVPATIDEAIDPFWLYRGVQGRRRASLLDDVRQRAGEDRP